RSMNSCTTQSDLHCITCHTSSGRYRFKSDDLLTGNKACTSCHEEKEEGYAGHTHHKINQNSPKCIDCHMPLTRFGNMNRSDHSFRPPMPAASLKFGSPNACIICHTDKSNQWANANVIKWNGGDYQKKTLEAGQLILEARNNEWKNLDLMLEVVRTNKYGEVFTNSFIRLLENCPNEKKWVAFMEAVKHNSPLVRSAALLGLSGNYSDDVKKVMFQAADEEYRLVRL